MVLFTKFNIKVLIMKTIILITDCECNSKYRIDKDSIVSLVFCDNTEMLKITLNNGSTIEIKDKDGSYFRTISYLLDENATVINIP